MKTSRFIISMLLGLSLAACDSGKGEKGDETKTAEAKTEEGADEGGEAAEEGGEEATGEEASGGSQPTEVKGPIAIEFKPTDEQKAKMDELKKGIKNERFDFKERSNNENGKLFLAIAAEVPESKEEKLAALDGMQATWASRENKNNMPVVDKDYVAVITEYLNTPDAQVLERTLAAAERALPADWVDVALVEKIVAIGERPDPATKYEVLDTLWVTQKWRSNPKIAALYMAALDHKEPWVVSEALFRIGTFASSFHEADKLRAKAKELLKHEDPGVRGRAALTYAGMARSDEEKSAAVADVKPLLKDENAFVRSAAAKALGYTGQKEVVPEIMVLLDDAEKNTYDIEGWTRLDGKPGRQHHDGSAWSTVNDAALQALSSSTSRLGDKRFKSPKISYKTKDEDLKTAVAEAKKWFEENKAEFGG